MHDSSETIGAKEFHAEFPADDMPPEFRAWYSSQSRIPGPYDDRELVGATTPAPSAADTIFARDPEVVEAMEALHTHTMDRAPDPDPEHFEVKPLDTGMALRGLKKLRAGEELGGLVMPERSFVVQTRKRVRIEHENASLETTARPAQPDSNSQQPAAEAPAANGNTFRQDVERVTDAMVREWDGQVEFSEESIDLILGLSEYFVASGSDRVKVLSNARYSSALSKIAKEALEDPQQAIEFFKAAKVMGGEALRQGDASSIPVIDLAGQFHDDYRKAIVGNIIEPSDLAARQSDWFSLVGRLPADRNYSLSRDFYAQPTVKTTDGGPDLKLGTVEEYERNVTIWVSDIWGEVISNSLVFLAESKPEEAFRLMYDLALEGMDPEHKSKFSFTFNLLKHTVNRSDKLKAFIAFHNDPEDLEQSASLVDFTETMSALGYNIIAMVTAQCDRYESQRNYPKYLQRLLKSKDPTQEDIDRITERFGVHGRDGKTIYHRLALHGNPLAPASRAA